MSSPSHTATKIARFMLLLDALPAFRGVLPSRAAETAEAILRGSGSIPPRRIDAMRKPSTARLYAFIERWLGRGQLLWFGVRKRWLADAVEAAIDGGARQLLVVGAGFDPLAVLVAASHPDVLCLEIDAPATAGPKRTGVRRAGLSRANHLVVDADLSRRPLREVLADSGWRSGERSIVVAEGLLMYLAPEDVRGFFTAVRDTTAPGSRVAFSSVGADDRGRPRLGALDGPIRFALRIVGEPMRWGIRPEDVAAFLSSLGMRTIDQPTLDTLRARLLDPLGLHDEPLAPYEHLVLAERT